MTGSAIDTSTRRIYITGPAGSGKTVLARRLSARLQLPLHDMDEAVNLGRTKDVDAGADGWIVEGVFVWDVERFVCAADVILWLDLPLRTTIPRIVRRHFRLSLLGRNRFRGIRLLIRFVQAQPHYFTAAARPPTGVTDWDAITRANQLALLQPHMDKVVHLRSAADVRRWWRDTRAHVAP